MRTAKGNGMDDGEGLTLATCSIDMRFALKDVDRAVQLLLSVTGPTQAKRGCRECRVATEAAEPGLVHYREEWDSEQAFERNVRSDEFLRVLIAIDMCREEPRIVVGKHSGIGGATYLRKLREEAGVGT
jgi:quinol monooxygenase YgiN